MFHGYFTSKQELQEVDYDSSKVDEILQIIDGHDTRANAISINDEMLRDADKLSRYTRHDFCLVVETFGMVAEDACRGLESLIEQWFCLPQSKEMAREELKQRRQAFRQFNLEVFQRLPIPFHKSLNSSGIGIEGSRLPVGILAEEALCQLLARGESSQVRSESS